MTENSAKTAVGLSIVICHFFVLLVVLFSPLYAKLPVRQALSLATVIAPLTAGFVTAIVKFFTKSRVARADTSSEVTAAFIFISFLLPGILFFVTLFFFLGFALNWLNIDFETVRWVITGLEALFGGYIGFVLEGLFDYHPPSTEGK